MLTRTKGLRTSFLLLLLAVIGFVAFPFVQVGIMLMGHQLSPAHEVESVRTVWPVDGEQLSTLTPTIRWPSAEATSWSVTLHKVDTEQKSPVLTAELSSGKLAVPPATLDDDAVYTWAAVPSDGAQVASHAGSFRTSTRSRQGPLAVSPSVYTVSPATFRHGLQFDVTAPDGMTVEVLLPDVLTAGGSRRVVMTGSFRLPVRPALEISQLETSEVLGLDGLATISFLADEFEVSVPVRFDVSEQGHFIRAVKSGFDPVLDTPAFANFADGLLAKVTRGTCLGMVLAARQSFAHCNACEKAGDCWRPRLRLRSLLEGDIVKEEMNFLHLANLNPGNWSTAVSSALTDESQPDVASEVLVNLRAGVPVPLAILERRGPAQGPGLGHAVLAYAAHEFEDHHIIFVYDPDRTHRKGDAQRSFVLVPKAEQGRPDVIFRGVGGEEHVEVYTLPDSAILDTLSPRLAGLFTSVDRQLARGLPTP
jgi:hypothetical protein